MTEDIMDIKVRKFEGNDIKSMIDIWNEVVEEGIAFPQLDSLNEKTGLEFFSSQWLLMRTMKFWDFTYFILIMSADAVTYQMRAMR